MQDLSTKNGLSQPPFPIALSCLPNHAKIRGRAGGRARRFVFVPPNLDSFITVHKLIRFRDGSLPLAPTAVHIRTFEPQRFEPFHRLGEVVIVIAIMILSSNCSNRSKYVDNREASTNRVCVYIYIYIYICRCV